MSEQGSLLGFLSDPRLAPYATGDIPAWLWSADATRILWGNPAAAAIFNAASSTALTGHTIDPKGSAALQIARLAGTLPHGAAPRLERLRGFGGRMGGALMCTCSRISLADRTPAILVVATEAAGPASFARPSRRSVCSPAATSRWRCSRRRHAAACDASGAGPSLAAPRKPRRARRGTARRHRARRRPRRRRRTAPAGFRSSALAPMHRPPCWRPSLPGNSREGRYAAPSPTRGEPRNANSQHPVASRSRRHGHRPRPPIAGRPTPNPPQPPPQPAATATAERRQPLRFVWQMDDDGRFTLDSDEFKTLIGPQTAAALGQPWSEIATALRPRSRRPGRPRVRLARHLERHHRRLPGGRHRHAACRRTVRTAGVRPRPQLPRLSRLRRLPRCRAHQRIDRRRAAPLRRPHRASSRRCSATSRPRLRAVPPPMNVVPFPASTPAESVPTLTPVERKAFSELATRLTARLRGPKDKPRASPKTPAPARCRREAGCEAAVAAPKNREPTRDRTNRASARRRSASDPRPAAGRRAGLSARQADLRQPRLPRLDRLRPVARAGRGRRPRRAVRRAERHRARRRTTARNRSPSPPIRATRCRSRRGCSPRRGKANPRWC